MPFPLAHPAAVLPLRRQCPRRFNFPALVIGSLSPDVGYCFGRLHLDEFSHRFAGSFGFCLPVGLLLLLLFYLLRRPVVQRLPARLRRIFEPLCLRPVGSLFVIVVSLLVGSWTHIFLDSMTHENGWLVEHLPILQTRLAAGEIHFRVCDVLYAAFTFAGVLYVGLVYLNWLEWAAGTSNWIFPGFKLTAALTLATLTLLLSFANHDITNSLGLSAIGILTGMLVIVSFTVTGWALRGIGRHENEIRFQKSSRSARTHSRAARAGQPRKTRPIESN
jgi:Domain of unknown function (DUF4184)